MLEHAILKSKVSRFRLTALKVNPEIVGKDVVHCVEKQEISCSRPHAEIKLASETFTEERSVACIITKLKRVNKCLYSFLRALHHSDLQGSHFVVAGCFWAIENSCISASRVKRHYINQTTILLIFHFCSNSSTNICTSRLACYILSSEIR